MCLFAHLIVTANAACTQYSFRAELSPSSPVPAWSYHIGQVCMGMWSSPLAWGQVANLQILCEWDLSRQCYILTVQLRTPMVWWGWVPVVSVSWGSFYLDSLSLTEDSKIIWGGDTIRIDCWSVMRSVTRERSVITWASPNATFSWILTRCLIAAEFVLPSSAGVISLSSSPFVCYSPQSPPAPGWRFLTISLLSKVFPPGLPIPGHCIPGLSQTWFYKPLVFILLGRAHIWSHWGLCTGKLLYLGTLVRSLVFLLWDCLSLDADAMAWSATHICKPS